MALMLGIDTGGTFTDAVLVVDDAAANVVATAKAPTTHEDLTIGLANAVRNVLDAAGASAIDQIRLVSVSTTLATNSLVEGHGDPAGLFTFGFSARELERSGIANAVEADLLVRLSGGHDAHGNEQKPIDRVAIEQAAKALESRVAAFAVTSQFSVRNPAHEREAAEIVRAATGKPVTTSHVLSAKLDGPRRALTAALNARLLGTIDRLNHAVRSVMSSISIDAPLMVVRGDGSLVSADFAAERPIETILSGPAASVVGALHLAGLTSGLVADIGGTTTDVAVIDEGRPSISDGGAVVGGHRTMVEAVAMSTTGLGGDSEVLIDTRASEGPVVVGPARAIPIGRLAIEYPEVHTQLDRQLAAPVGLVSHGRFLACTAAADVVVVDDRERDVLGRLRGGPLPVDEATTSGLEKRAAERLQRRGLVRIATLTPTDASALLHELPGVDSRASRKVAALLARQTSSTGGAIATDPTDLAEWVIDRLADMSAEFVVRVALTADGVEAEGAGDVIAASLAGHQGAAAVNVGLSGPLTAIGAPAEAYYHQIAERAGTTALIPEHARVANAIGAVVGRVRVRQSATITQPTRGQFRVHLDDQPTFGSIENAKAKARDLLHTAVVEESERAGADAAEVNEIWQERIAEVNGKQVFVEGTLILEASGRPRF